MISEKKFFKINNIALLATVLILIVGISISKIYDNHQQQVQKNVATASTDNAESTENNTNSQSTINENNSPDLELLDKDTKYENGIMYIVGHIKNNTNERYSSVFVNINLYDDNDVRVGDAISEISNLEAGEVWSFKVSTSVRFTKYKIADIHGY